MAVVYLERDGQQFGPFSIEEAQRYILEGRFGAQDLGWIDGMQEWLLVAQIPQLTGSQTNSPNLAKPAGLGNSAPATPSTPPSPTAPANAPYAAPSYPGPINYSGPQHPVSAISQDFSQADYAGFWRRSAALTIDSILVTIVVYFLLFVLMLIFGLGMGVTGMTGLDSGDTATDAIAIATIAFPALLSISYYAFWHASASMATPGKMAAGLVVVNSSAQRITVAQAFLREFVKLIGTWFFFLTFVTQPISARRQAVHDFASATLVLRQRPDAGMPSVVVWLINLSWVALLFIAIAGFVAFVH